ncbi:MAG: hypothetical protein IT379_19385 [Deltaproteobacteria bacterium]|nr:hypothetical protein [Deltaproteobacteria bacterium]
MRDFLSRPRAGMERNRGLVISQTPGARLSLVSGPRSNLMKVETGERVLDLPSAALHRRRLHELVAACWDRFSYAEAQRLIISAPSEVRDAHTDRWEQLSGGFALWDSWDHAGALKVLEPFGRYAGEHMPTLRSLVRGRDGGPEADAQRIVDVYLSAERRARAHHYDAAVLRLYRALEWVAQWTLRWHNKIETSDVRRDSPIAKHATEDDISGTLVLSCIRAWRAVAELEGPLKVIANGISGDQRIRTLAELRNKSVLAHGDRALGRVDYEAARAGIDRDVWGSFVSAAGRVRTIQLPHALPTDEPRSGADAQPPRPA